MKVSEPVCSLKPRAIREFDPYMDLMKQMSFDTLGDFGEYIADPRAALAVLLKPQGD